MDGENNTGNGGIKNVLRKSLFILRKPILILILVGIIALLIIAASAHELKIIDGTQDDSDPKNGPAAANRYINDVEITNDGDILLSMTPQELWDELLKNGNRLTDYLSSPQELARLMNAQIATEYLDTNPDKEKDWDKINKNVDSDESRIVQGIVKLKRRTANLSGDETTYYLKYKSPEEFNKLVENGNNDALKYFTLDKRIASNTGSNSSLSSGSGSGQDIINEAEKYVGVLDYVWAGASLETGADCSGFVWAILNKLGLYNGERADTTKFEEEGVGTTIPSLDQAQAGDVICYEGHVAFYDGNGGIIHAPGRGKKVTHSENGATYKEIKTIKRFTSGSSTTSGTTGTGNISSITSTSLTREQFIEKVQSYAEAISLGSATQEFRDNAGIIYDVCTKNNINPVLCAAQGWLEQGWDDPPGAVYNFWGIGVYNGQNYGKNYPSMEGGVQGYCDQINSQINGSMSSTYQEKAKKFATVNNKFRGDMSTIYDIFSAYAYVGKDHTLEEEANYAANYCEQLIACANQIFGTGSLDAGASIGGNGSSIKYKYVAKIAARSSGGGLTTQTIEYKNYMNKYTLPFNYLFAMLIIGNDKDLVFDLADLVYNSKFEITIHDSVTRTTVEKHLETITQRTVEGGRTTTSSGSVAEPTEVTDTYTTMVDLTLADSWIVKYEKEYDLEQSTFGPTQERETTVAGYPRTSSTLNSDQKRVNETTTAVRVIDTTIVNYTYTSSSSPKPIEKTDKDATEPNFVTVFLDNYDGRSNIFGATDWLFEILEKNEDTKDMIDLTKYLFYKITGRDYGFTDFDEVWNAFRQESFNSVGGMYGGTFEEKIWFALLDAGYSKEAAAGAMGNFYGESNINSKCVQGDYLKSNPTQYDEEYTSKVDSGEISKNDFVHNGPGGGGYGLAQWTYYTRKDGLYEYAKRKGVSIGDENMQIEYLIAELSPSGGLDGLASAIIGQIQTSYTRSDWEKASTPEDAARAFCDLFEGPGFFDPIRSTKAREYYEKFKNMEKASGGEFNYISNYGSQIIGTFTSSVTGRTFTIFNQMQINGWGSCCNRAAQISVCSGYYNGNPLDLISQTSPDCPGKRDLYNMCGLTNRDEVSSSSSLPAQTIRNQIQGGGYIIVYLKGKDAGHSGFSKYDRKWASSMHWVAILGYRIENGKEEMFISDSGHNNSGWMPIDEFDGMVATGQRSLIFINEK